MTEFHCRALPVAALAAVSLIALPPVSAQGGAASTPGAAPAPQKCLEAVVSPVSGFAECVNPRGAPVVKPPPRPDAPCAANARDCGRGPQKERP